MDHSLMNSDALYSFNQCFHIDVLFLFIRDNPLLSLVMIWFNYIFTTGLSLFLPVVLKKTQGVLATQKSGKVFFGRNSPSQSKRSHHFNTSIE